MSIRWPFLLAKMTHLLFSLGTFKIWLQSCRSMTLQLFSWQFFSYKLMKYQCSVSENLCSNGAYSNELFLEDVMWYQWSKMIKSLIYKKYILSQETSCRTQAELVCLEMVKESNVAKWNTDINVWISINFLTFFFCINPVKTKGVLTIWLK